MSVGRLWTREEFIITLSLYFQLPFGRLNRNTPEVIALAKLIGRSNNSVALRLVNFAACDPYIIATGRHGMSSGINVCKPIWDEFANNKEKLFFEAEKIRANYMKRSIIELLTQKQQKEIINYVGEEREAYIKERVNQNVFRATILANYENRCAVTGINVPELLVASHIVPWADDTEHRLDPSNGLCLSALYDKAFDRGLIAVDPNDYTILISNELRQYSKESYYHDQFQIIERQKIIEPVDHLPNPEFLQYHIDRIFSRHN